MRTYSIFIALILALLFVSGGSAQQHENSGGSASVSRYGSIVPGHCALWASGTQLGDAGDVCGTGGGGANPPGGSDNNLQIKGGASIFSPYPGTSCPNQAVTGLDASGVASCVTITSDYVDPSIAQTGVDINNTNQVTGTHLSAALPEAQGGTGQTSYTQWPINIPHQQTISGDADLTLQTAWITTEELTFSASATVTLPQGTFPGQVLNVVVCQNGTGGFTPSFAAAAGLTIQGTFPAFTQTASKCGNFSLSYITTTKADLMGSTAGPL